MQTSGLLNTYFVDPHTWDEMYDQDRIREQYRHVVNYMQQLSLEELNRKEELARRLFMSQGITFTVYNSGEGNLRKFFPSISFPASLPLPNGVISRKVSSSG